MKLSIQIDKQFRSQVNRRWLRTVVSKTLATAEASSGIQLDLLITDDETIHTLNREYRNVDRPTDVLAFALDKDSRESEPFVLPPDLPTHLGDVVVSYPTAARQAEEHHHTVDQEITILVVHGVLHLLGYDHSELAEENEMRTLEYTILREIEGKR